jgi:hypothetical protein
LKPVTLNCRAPHVFILLTSAHHTHAHVPMAAARRLAWRSLLADRLASGAAAGAMSRAGAACGSTTGPAGRAFATSTPWRGLAGICGATLAAAAGRHGMVASTAAAGLRRVSGRERARTGETTWRNAAIAPSRAGEGLARDARPARHHAAQ